ncbi:MAG: arylesterase [Verrucomicrobiaceae bacterium]|nr:MAG: arylesterase [Verrucomicrobiaceae bacterium]
MTSLRALTLVILVWMGMAPALCAGNETPPTPAGKRGRIVVLGDSITAGYGLTPAQAYPALLQEKVNAAGFPYDVVNAGVSGDTTAGGLRRVDWALSRGGADILVVALGGNDGLRGIQPKQTASNLTGIVQKARAKSPGVAVIIAGMQMPTNMGTQYIEEFRAVFSRVAEESKAALIPFLLDGVGGVAELNQQDQIHPTAEGQKRVADNVWPVLEKVLKERAAAVK